MTKEMPVEQSQPVQAGHGAAHAAKPSAKMVADEFVKQYYKVLESHSRYLHRFYDKTSTLTVSEVGPNGQERAVTAHDQEAIHDRLMEFFSEASARVETVCSQASAGEGVIMLVMGRLSRKGKPDCRFSQTLFLAVQSKGFFVLNDIISLTPIMKVAESSPQPVHSQEVPIPVRMKQEADRSDSDRGSSPGTPARRDYPPYTGPHVQPARRPEPHPAKGAPHTPNSSGSSSSDTTPQSRAAMSNDCSGDLHNLESEPRKPPQNCEDLAPQRTSSIFVRGIPDDADARALAAAFSKYGRLREGGVTIKQGRRDRFAFVEFDSATDLEGVLGGNVRVNGQTVMVEEKRPMVIRKPGRVKRSLSGHSAHSREPSQVSSPGYVGSPSGARPFHHPQMAPHPLQYMMTM
eukprot:evm.model.scf_3319.1 EVM.evm.TU.scf_3319.1   scf_3319:1481-4363(+)